MAANNSKKNSKPRQPKVVDAEVEEVQNEAPNGVFLTRVVDEETGDITVNASPVGNVSPTEVATIIKMGGRSWDALIFKD